MVCEMYMGFSDVFNDCLALRDGFVCLFCEIVFVALTDVFL